MSPGVGVVGAVLEKKLATYDAAQAAYAALIDGCHEITPEYLRQEAILEAARDAALCALPARNELARMLLRALAAQAEAGPEAWVLLGDVMAQRDAMGAQVSAVIPLMQQWLGEVQRIREQIADVVNGPDDGQSGRHLFALGRAEGLNHCAEEMLTALKAASAQAEAGAGDGTCPAGYCRREDSPMLGSLVNVEQRDARRAERRQARTASAQASAGGEGGA